MGLLDDLLPIAGGIVGGLLGGPAGAQAGAIVGTSIQGALADQPAVVAAPVQPVTGIVAPEPSDPAFGGTSFFQTTGLSAATLAFLGGGLTGATTAAQTAPVTTAAVATEGTSLGAVSTVIRGVRAVGGALASPAGQIAQVAAGGAGAAAALLTTTGQNITISSADQFAALQALSAQRGAVSLQTGRAISAGQIFPAGATRLQGFDTGNGGVGMAAAFTQTVVQTVQRGTNIVLKQVVLRGSPHLMNHDLVVAKRVFRLANKLHAKMPRRAAKRRDKGLQDFSEFIKAQSFQQALCPPPCPRS